MDTRRGLELKEQTELNILSENLAQLQVSENEAAALQQHQSQHVEVRVSASGQPYLGVLGVSVYPENDTLKRVAMEAASLVQGKETDLVVFFGLGLGLHLEFMRKFTDAPIIVFEPDFDVIREVLEKIPLQLDRVTLVTNSGRLVQRVQMILDHAAKGMLAGALPGWVQQRPEALEHFKDALQQAGRKVELDRKTRAAYSAEWVNHIAKNLPFYARMPVLNSLARKFEGKPAILVGAGPSLDGSLEGLRKAKGHALICAVHTATKPLIKAGIIPDLVVIIESQKLLNYFEGLEDLDRITFVPSVQTHPLHLELEFGHFMGLSMEGNAVADWMQEAFDVEPLPASSSVSGVSFSMLHALGCNPLVLVGMDCALTDNRTHASQSVQGTIRMGKKLKEGRFSFVADGGDEGEFNTHEVVAWGGEGKILARPVYTTYRHWFEGVAQTWAAGRTLINATEGGARIHGFLEQSLAEALDQHCQVEFSPEAVIHAALDNAEPLDQEAFAQVVDKELDTIAHAVQVAEMADKKAGKALGMLAAGNLTAVQPVLDELSVYEKKLQEITQKTRLLNTLVGHRAQELTLDSPAPKEKVAATMHSVRQSQKITKLVREGSTDLLGKFRPVVAALRAQA